MFNIERILGHKTYLNELNAIAIIQKTCSQTTMELNKTNKQETVEKSSKYLKAKQHTTYRSKRKSQKKFFNVLNENTPYQNLWDAETVVHREKFIASNSCLALQKMPLQK